MTTRSSSKISKITSVLDGFGPLRTASIAALSSLSESDVCAIIALNPEVFHVSPYRIVRMADKAKKKYKVKNGRLVYVK